VSRDPRIVAELETVRRRSRTGKLYPKAVVEFAKDPETALHKRFVWDDTEAAQRYRLDQARDLIQLVVKVVAENRPAYRAYVSLTRDRLKGGGYREIEVVLRDEAMYGELLEDALADLKRLEEKYGELKELRTVWQAAHAVKPRRQRKAA